MDDAFSGAMSDETKTLDIILEKYVTNDDVGGGLPKLLDMYFDEHKATEFEELDDIAMKREYFNLFNEIDKWMGELRKVAELFSALGRNPEKTLLANERLEER